MMKFLVSIFLLLIGYSAFGQQDAQYTQYMYNTIAINPAYAGNRGMLSAIALHRSQWVGLDGAPETQSISLHSPVGLGRLGLGLSIVNDKLGPSSETYFNGDISYTIQTSVEGRLSFGLKLGAHVLDVDFNKLNLPPGTVDPAFENNIDNRLTPNIGTGIYYHTDKFYAGLSAPNLLRNEHFEASNNTNNNSSFVAAERIHYYLTGGYVFDINPTLKFKPSTMIKAVAGAPLQVDLTANFLISEKLTLGAAYRLDAAVSGLIGYQVSDQVSLGFAYDRETTELGNTQFDDGSFEVFVRFELFNSYNRMLTPRFF
ncbi:membrane protein [Nonlabens sp. YIK11]|uniref:PorP/SprF family type IX secretion system membrane protein n=1 Tax=Nonlabens sp. YIK11 TaxID=1453349 RepID=UPI0006DCC722|nr:type IX secretion system membrane protein PorP/SprF [Nonlabens sp. YIK11]KQC34525.1 membrane protein [Nonlabens sp. YIK11]